MSHISLCNSVPFYLLNTFISFIWKIQYVCVSVCVCVYLNAHVFQRAHICCCSFFFIVVVCVASFVPVCIWYAYLSAKVAHTHKHKQRERAFEKSLRSRLQLIQNVVISSVEIARTFFKYMALLKCTRKNGWCACSFYFPLSFCFSLYHAHFPKPHTHIHSRSLALCPPACLVSLFALLCSFKHTV